MTKGTPEPVLLGLSGLSLTPRQISDEKVTEERRTKGGDPGDPPQPGTGSDQRSGLLLLERLLGETAATELPFVSVLATEDARLRAVECNQGLLLVSLSLRAGVATDEPLLHA